ncbi:MAG: hypothetical protein M5R36_26655 [Deltaproteobacteria bacterium]|nr:hypothetical protein [Deltaproteobacteria bacterium]
MKRGAIILLVLAVAFAAASCQGCRPPAAEDESGFDSPEELAKVYLESISKKDYDLFQSLLLGKDDLRPFAKHMNKQGVTVYHQFVLRDFKAKNRDYLGKPLTFVAFRLGREIWTTDKYGLHRASTVIAELSDGTKANLEINFVSRIGQKWKIFSLRYLKDLKGANPGQSVPETLPGAKFGPPANKVQMKIKKIEKDDDESSDDDEAAEGDEAPAEGDAEASGDEGEAAPAPEDGAAE